MKLTRDSLLWTWTFGVGLVLAVGTWVADLVDLAPELIELGVDPKWIRYLRIAGLILAVIGGKNGNSWLPGKGGRFRRYTDQPPASNRPASDHDFHGTF